MTQTALDPSASARLTRGRTPVSSVIVKGDSLDVTVNELRVNYAEGQHDTATMSCISTTMENTEGLLDAPIQFYFGIAPRSGIFYGYITDLTNEQKAQGQLSFSLSMMGPTKQMFEGKPRFWSNKTASAAISNLVNLNALGYTGTSHPYAWRSFAQTEESDWSMIHRLAARIGFVLYSRFGVILAYDPTEHFKMCAPYCRLVSQSGIDAADTPNDRTLIEFNATASADILVENLGKKFGYFTSDNEVQIRQQTGEFKGFVFESSMPIVNQDEAAAMVAAADISISNWRNHATARMWGDADIYPGQCVEVKTVQAGRYVKTDGKWLVRLVSHQADRQSYQTLLTLSRPDTWSISLSNSYRPFWEEDMSNNRARPYLYLDANNRWVSSWTNPTAAVAAA
jgi:hypothetical protein